MTETIDTAARSRRALLAGGLGAAGAWLATSLHAPAVNAGVDGDVILGSSANASATTTKVTVATQEFSAFWGEATGGNGVGVRGDANATYGIGVLGNAASQAGTGVKGNSGGVGVFGEGGLHGLYGFSTTGTGVTAVGAQYGLDGSSTHGIGVRGSSGDGIGVRATAGTGDAIVAASTGGTGVAASSKSGRGVEGRSETAFGVYGRSDSGTGVIGVGPAGVGVRGESSAGTGVHAVTTTGFALRTSGRLRIDKVSGIASIPAGKTSLTVSPGVDVSPSSFVLLTPKANIGSRSLWFTMSTSENTITIRISSRRSTVTPVSWLLLG